MSQLYTAEVIADSISPMAHRITTVKVIYPHAVHKDMLRHRNQNRNVESFRAQPPEKIIANLRNGHAFKPEVFAKRTKGMQQGGSLDDAPAGLASCLWDEYVATSCRLAERFLELDIAKQQVNFVLQDLAPLTEIITATDWSNFLALRTELDDNGNPVARPEVYQTAKAIGDALEASKPTELDYNDWHLPFVTEAEKAQHSEKDQINISAGRCARISYGDFKWWEEDPKDSIGRSGRLLQAGHMSPYEQQAQPFSETRRGLVNSLQAQIHASDLPDLQKLDMMRQLTYSGNLHGWVPARKTFINEHDYSLIKGA